MLDPALPPFRPFLEDIVHALGFHDANGMLLPNAFDEAAELLRHFVTEGGTLPADVRPTLGERGLGRTRFVRLILRAFVGPEPNVPAWRAALASKGFGDAEGKSKSPSNRRNAKRGTASPGLYLPRELQKTHSQAPRPCVPAKRGWLHTDTAVQAAIALGLLLKRACSAGMALGPALVVSKATDRLSPSQWRQLDAQLFNESFIAALAEAISDVLAKNPLPRSAERTSAQVRTSIRGGRETLERHFMEREEHLISAAAERIHHALRRLLAEEDPDDEITAYRTTAVKLRDIAKCETEKASVAGQVEAATSYLRRSQKPDAEEQARHHRFLRGLMRDMTQPRSRKELDIITDFAFDEWAGLDASAQDGAALDVVHQGIVAAIRKYVEEIGPPPVGVPIHHIAIFERQAIAVAREQRRRWRAGEEWNRAALLGDHLAWIFET